MESGTEGRRERKIASSPAPDPLRLGCRGEREGWEIPHCWLHVSEAEFKFQNIFRVAESSDESMHGYEKKMPTKNIHTN